MELKNLVFGVELWELKYDQKNNRFEFNSVAESFCMRGPKPRRIKGPALVSGNRNDRFIEFEWLLTYPEYDLPSQVTEMMEFSGTIPSL